MNTHAALLALSILNFRVSISVHKYGKSSSVEPGNFKFLTYSRQVRLRSVFRPLYKITKRQYHEKINTKKGLGSALMPGVPIRLVGLEPNEGE